MLRVLGHGLAVAALTVLTQIGGVIWLLAQTTRLMGASRRIAALVFVALYGASLVAVPMVTPSLSGRVALPCFEQSDAPLKSATVLYCALHRHYVVPELAAVTEKLARHMDNRFPGTTVLTLDGSFPFLDGFPMLPHLSHDDGETLDLPFFYLDADGDPAARLRSPIGYFAFDYPAEGEREPCRGSNATITMRWDLRWLQPLFADLPLDDARNREMMRWLTQEGARQGVSRIFIEPHLVDHWNAQSPVTGFQGCRAARHDDHIHFQL